MYYDDANPKFLDLLETAALLYQSEGEESGERTAEERTHRKKSERNACASLSLRMQKAVILSVNYG